MRKNKLNINLTCKNICNIIFTIKLNITIQPQNKINGKKYNFSHEISIHQFYILFWNKGQIGH